MDKGILRFMAGAYLLLHPGPTVESVAPSEKEHKNKQRRQRCGPSVDNKESQSGKPREEG